MNLPELRITIKEVTVNRCCICGSTDNLTPLVSDNVWYHRGAPYVYSHSYCDACWKMEYAMREARLENIKYMEVACDEENRCACGKPSVAALMFRFCWTCWHEYRMLDRQESEHRAIRRMIGTLKEELKNVGLNKDNRTIERVSRNNDCRSKERTT
jgi:recombinational DNA repair protein (RecF pathway)